MSYCEHCEGQRFDRARVLRALRQLQKELSVTPDASSAEAIDRALKAIRSLDVPHLEWAEDDDAADEIVH